MEYAGCISTLSNACILTFFPVPRCTLLIHACIFSISLDLGTAVYTNVAPRVEPKIYSIAECIPLGRYDVASLIPPGIYFSIVEYHSASLPNCSKSFMNIPMYTQLPNPKFMLSGRPVARLSGVLPAYTRVYYLLTYLLIYLLIYLLTYVTYVSSYLRTYVRTNLLTYLLAYLRIYLLNYLLN